MQKFRLIALLMVLVLTFASAVAETVPVIEHDPADMENYTELSSCLFSDIAACEEKYGVLFLQESEGMKIYANEQMMLVGSETVEGIMLIGGEYTVYGAAVGMPIDEAAEIIAASGLDKLDYETLSGSVTFMRCTSEDSPVDYDGYDSYITLTPEDGVVADITWLSYTFVEMAEMAGM